MEDDEYPRKRPQPAASFHPPSFFCARGAPLSALNPGSIANLHKKTRDIVPEWIEGLKVRCAANLDANRAVNMEWLMGNSTPFGFRLGGMICRKDCCDGRITVSNYDSGCYVTLVRN
jgi:hypothetical protein